MHGQADAFPERRLKCCLIFKINRELTISMDLKILARLQPATSYLLAIFTKVHGQADAFHEGRLKFCLIFKINRELTISMDLKIQARLQPTT